MNKTWIQCNCSQTVYRRRAKRCRHSEDSLLGERRSTHVILAGHGERSSAGEASGGGAAG